MKNKITTKRLNIKKNKTQKMPNFLNCAEYFEQHKNSSTKRQRSKNPTKGVKRVKKQRNHEK